MRIKSGSVVPAAPSAAAPATVQSPPPAQPVAAPPAPVVPPPAPPSPAALAVRSTAVGPAELALPDYVEENPEGFEHAKSDGIYLPRLVLGQGQSPAVMAGKVPLGSVSLSSNKEEAVFPRDVRVPFFIVFHHRQWTQWGNRDTNEGMIAQSFDPEGDLARMAARREKVTFKTKEGDKTVDKVRMSHRFFIVFEADEPGKLFTDPVALVLSSSGVKTARKLIQLAQKRGNAPLYAGRYVLSSILETNKKNGKQYFNFEVDNDGWATKPQYDILKAAFTKAKEEYQAITDLLIDERDEDEEAEATAVPAATVQASSY